jgi:hypothetical protein
MPEQQPQPPADGVRSLVAGCAQALLTDLTRSGEGARTEVASRAGGGGTVLALAFPSPSTERAADLTDCDRDCLKLLAGADRPLSAVKVHRELRKRHTLWGETTVKRSLARMKRMKILYNSRVSPKGYFLPEALPIVRRAAGA